ncbi:MAG: hypothetical protein JNJ54_35360 [Myxococcaceae bacterium]|nr:hypothetical protein [Myxococcaceae bacterium]
MFSSTTQTFTFFFVSDAAQARNQSVQQTPLLTPTATAPVRVKWVLATPAVG